MAALTPGKLQGTWKAYYYDRVTKKQVWLPAEVVCAWDGLARPAAEEALETWLSEKGLERIRSRRRSLLDGSALQTQLEEYEEYMRGMRAAQRSITIRDEMSRLRTYALSYFVQHHGLTDVRQWWRHTEQYGLWVQARNPNMRVWTAKKMCKAVEMFGRYLAGRQIIPQPWLVAAPRRKQKRKTPLVRAIKPDEIIGAAGGLAMQDRPDWALFILLTYFATLRPEETYALELGDFITGDKARAQAKTYDRLRKHGLGSGLTISVSKTHVGEAPEPYTKTHYATGKVNVWSSDGAREISAILKGRKPGRLFVGTRADLNAGFKKLVQPLLGVKAKDLERAAGFHLGREVGLDPILIQDMFRHAVITTSMLYTRPPEEAQEQPDKQDFDDVMG